MTPSFRRHASRRAAGLRAISLALSACFFAVAASARAQSSSDEDATKDGSRDRCEQVSLDVSPSLSAPWRDAADKLRAELAKSQATCVAAQLSLEAASGDAARLIVTAPDGRRTERDVARPALLVSTAIGVIASLPSDSTTLPPDETSPAPTVVHEETRFESRPSDETPAPESMTHLWVGVSSGARVAEPTFLGMIDIEGHATLEINQWLILASIRYGSSMGEALVSTDDSYDEIAGSAGIGRRFLIGPSQIEAVILPSLVSATLDDQDETVANGSPRAELRVGALLGWSLTTEDGWRFTVSADTDVTPRSFDRPVRSAESEPPLPVWTAALRLGAAGRIL